MVPSQWRIKTIHNNYANIFLVFYSEILYDHYKKHSRNAWEYLFTKIILVRGETSKQVITNYY